VPEPDIPVSERKARRSLLDIRQQTLRGNRILLCLIEVNA
jgi:hypothetical protein